jgi:MarR family transcriptional regulator for hemolysin
VEERLGKQLAFAAKAARAEFDQALAGIGSSFHAYLVLRHIELYPGVTQRELARRLGIEGPTLTHHLDRLAADGLVKRVRGLDDRRTSSTVLTAKGRTHLRRVLAFADGLDADFRGLFSPSELQVFQECLQRVIHHYGRSGLDDDRARTG